MANMLFRGKISIAFLTAALALFAALALASSTAYADEEEAVPEQAASEEALLGACVTNIDPGVVQTGVAYNTQDQTLFAPGMPLYGFYYLYTTDGVHWVTDQDFATTRTYAGNYHVAWALYQRMIGPDFYVRGGVMEAEITKAEVPVPIAAEGLVYNGQEQTGVALDESGLYTLTGNTGTNAGSYTAVASLVDNDNYRWAGLFAQSETDDLYIPWFIAKAQVALPAAKDGLVYNGQDQTGVESDGSGLYTLTGNVAANAGDYTATASLVDAINYQWANVGGENESADQTVLWSIARLNIENAKVVLKDYPVYNGKELTQAIESIAVGSIAVDNYQVTGNTATQVGEYKLAIEGLGNFTGTTQVDWQVLAPSKHKPAKPSEKTKVKKNALPATGDMLGLGAAAVAAAVLAGAGAAFAARRNMN